MKTNYIKNISTWASIALLSLSAAMPARSAVQDAGEQADKENAKLQQQQEREKARQERDAERAYL